jgi:hypothetical protein
MNSMMAKRLEQIVQKISVRLRSESKMSKDVPGTGH